MNRKMLIMSSFLSTSLLVTNTLQVISCKKKGQKINDKNDNEKTAEQVELETATKLKTEIRNAIDEIITNPTANDWIVNLIVEFNDSFKTIIDIFNKAIETVKKEGNKNKIKLSQVFNLDETLIEKINLKFVSLREKIMERIEKKAIELGVSDLEFELDSESILPMLTTLTGKQVLEAVNRLKGLKSASNIITYSAILSASTIDDINQIDLFKVTTDLKYSFTFGNKQYTDDYNNCELFLTEDSENFKKLNRYTQETVTNLINNDEDMKNIQIYQGDYNFQENAPVNKTLEYIQNFEYIGKKMDWDFSKQEVKDEIKQMQYDNIKSSGKLRSIINDLKFEIENFNFEPLNYMKFTNDNLDIKQDNENCIFVCNKKIMKRNDVLQNIEKQYGLDENGTLKSIWDGGKINTKFIEQLKKDGEGENKIIDYSKYYGLSENAEHFSDFLVGYGKTTIGRVHYADIPLGELEIKTALTIPYSAAGMFDLYKDFKNHVGTVIDVIWNQNGESNGKGEGVQVRFNAHGMFMRWELDNIGEWEYIQTKFEETSSEEYTFNWLMDKVLLKKRILDNNNYKLPKNNAILDEAKILLNNIMLRNKLKITEKGVRFTGPYTYKLYIKYGPFVINLTEPNIYTYFVKGEGFSDDHYIIKKYE